MNISACKKQLRYSILLHIYINNNIDTISNINVIKKIILNPWKYGHYPSWPMAMCIWRHWNIQMIEKEQWFNISLGKLIKFAVYSCFWCLKKLSANCVKFAPHKHSNCKNVSCDQLMISHGCLHSPYLYFLAIIV